MSWWNHLRLFFVLMSLGLVVNAAAQRPLRQDKRPQSRGTVRSQGSDAPSPAKGTSTKKKEVVWTAYFSASANDPPPWAQTIRRTHAHDKAKSFLAAADVINTFTPNRQGGENFIKYIEKDRGDAWKKFIQGEAAQVVTIQKKTAHTMYWLVGNEISSPLQQEMWRRWAGKPAAQREKNDPFILPLYAEYFLAPTIEALRAVSQETGVKIPISLGSLGTGSSKANRVWYDKLLAYELKGEYAPSVKGKQVKDVVDYIAYHYTIAGEGWEESLDDYRKWIGQGTIKGMFDTEELGNQATAKKLGGTIAVRAFARYLYWWDKHDMTPDQGRVNFWAWSKGGDMSAKESMSVLHGFLGNSSLKLLKKPVVEGVASAEAYAFEADKGDKRMLIVCGPRSGSLALKKVRLATQGWDGKAACEMHLFSNKGHQKSGVTLREEGGDFIISSPADALLTEEATAVLLLTRNAEGR